MDPRSARALSSAAYRRRAVAGIALYLAAVALPVLVLLLADRPPGRSFLRDFSVALAFVALAMMGLQFALSARFKRLKAPYGIDVVYHFHREVSLVIAALVVSHPILLAIDDPATWQLFVVWSAPLRSRFAVAALLATLALLALSFWRRRVHLRYEPWRVTHGLLGVAAVTAAVVHVELVGYYVDSPWKRELWIVYPAIWVALLAWVRIVRPALVLRRPWRVSDVRPEQGGATTLRLEPVGHTGLSFLPGQFGWLTLGISPYAMREHPFSFSSAPSDDGSVEMTIKALGDFTAKIDATPVGERAYLDGPYGAFSIDRRPADAYVFIAGGVGVTPIMSNLRSMAARQDRTPVTLVYGFSRPEEMTFGAELDDLAARLDMRLVAVPAEAGPSWDGPSGFVTRDLLGEAIPHDRGSASYFICGPEPMMKAIAHHLHDLEVPPERVHYELFNLV